MQYAVELYYDEETQNKISALAEMIAQKNQYKIFRVENTTTPYFGVFS